MRKLGMFPQPKVKATYKAKPYEQMQYPGQRVQVDVKVVPLKCLTTRKNGYTSIRRSTNIHAFVIWAHIQNKALTLPLISWRKWWRGSNAVVCG